MSNILLLEDDTILSQEIKLFLNNNSLQCDCIYDGSFVESQFKLKEYDCLILDNKIN
jgi:DNA-binding response OmpR family regulator